MFLCRQAHFILLITWIDKNMEKNILVHRIYFLTFSHYEYTPGTRFGPGCCDRTLAVKSKRALGRGRAISKLSFENGGGGPAGVTPLTKTKLDI